ncbi:hypothetical protein K466DRAFT_198028 [Polyporus arcularius HHB13444]|uniref:Uncharacterized protein n=1 Tax=Polyporus arcularius HHB13444 TaxID=1314778 RepID=A0A5C3P8J2_9APHY|nr:hypothetical protein K466DRAFT_198028 [Polyporus arcularius HHB13444]
MVSSSAGETPAWASSSNTIFPAITASKTLSNGSNLLEELGSSGSPRSADASANATLRLTAHSCSARLRNSASSCYPATSADKLLRVRSDCQVLRPRSLHTARHNSGASVQIRTYEESIMRFGRASIRAVMAGPLNVSFRQFVWKQSRLRDVACGDICRNEYSLHCSRSRTRHRIWFVRSVGMLG